MAVTKKTEEKTTLDSDVTKPSVTAPGDGPADTTDPTERASTVGGDKAAAAKDGHLTVNAVVPVESAPAGSAVAEEDQRIEKYDVVKPDGSKATVTHNIDTGETKVS